MKKILIVDDYEENRYMLEALLNGSGYTAMVAANGAEALNMAHLSPPDLLITDILMPVMDGYTLCRTWHADPTLSKIPVVFYTATYTDPRDEAFARRLGAARFIRKPTEPDAFLAIVREVLDEAEAGRIVPPDLPEEKEVVYLRQYNETLIRKLEHKIRSLEETTRRLHEEARARATLIEHLEDRNAELERFVYTVSHDLKTPLVTINGFLGVLEEDLAEGAPAETIHADVAEVTRAVRHMGRLLDQLLQLARVGRTLNPPEAIPLTDLVQEVVARMPPLPDALCLEVAPDLPVVHGDRLRLAEVYQNLLENAVKFTAGVPEPHIRVGVRDDDGEPVLFVADNGIGIDPRYTERVFKLFEQLNPDREGSGVGLTLVKRIVEMHGGRIWIESEGAGTGCTLCFTLP